MPALHGGAGLRDAPQRGYGESQGEFGHGLSPVDVDPVGDEADAAGDGRLSNPPVTGSEYLTVIDVELLPGSGHDFHKHPDQEESIVCVKGPVEQWVDQERRMLSPGDAASIPADCVHATFNDGDEPAKVIEILGPCMGGIGYELVDVADQAPWNSLRVSP